MKYNKSLNLLLIILLLTLAVMSGMSGCNKAADDIQNTPHETPTADDSTEYEYTIEKRIKLPDDVQHTYGIGSIDNNLYIAAVQYEYFDKADIDNSICYTGIYFVDTDTGDVAILPEYRQKNYTPYITFQLFVDNNNNIWIADDNESIRMIDINGKDNFVFDSRNLVLENIYQDEDFNDNYFFGTRFIVDSDGYIYVGVHGWENDYIYVHDKAGKYLYNIKLDSLDGSILTLSSEGIVGFTQNNTDNLDINIINNTKQGIETTLTIPKIRATGIIPGFGDYDYIMQDFINIYGYKQNVEIKKLINLEENGISSIERYITILPDERIACINNKNNGTSEVIIFSKTPVTNKMEREKITLGAYNINSYIERMVFEFNRNNNDYYIEIEDYAKYDIGDTDNTGFIRFNTDLITGHLPDILDLSLMSYEEYALKGLLADLYQFIDNDPIYNRSDFVDGAFQAAEINGGLYIAFSHFYVNTITGPADILGSRPGWTFDEFLSAIKQNPEASIMPGYLLTGMEFFRLTISSNTNTYIDKINNIAHFDNSDFIQLLEFIKTFDERNAGIDPDTAYCIMTQVPVVGFQNIAGFKGRFNTDIVFKGYPTSDKNGGHSLTVEPALGIIEHSDKKEAAWEFVRMLFDSDRQLDGDPFYFPTNKAAFDTRAAYAMGHSVGGVTLTADDIEQAKTLIKSAQGINIPHVFAWNGGLDATLWNIVSEETTNYLNDKISAQEAADNIQYKISLYLAERG